jgi:hypothetical protein
MKRHHTTRVAVIGLLACMSLLAAACTEPPPPPTPVNWSFRGTSMSVGNSQDETCVIFCVNSEDEPYLYQVTFRVKIGEPGSAQTSVVKGSELSDVEAGETRTLSGGQQAQVTFNNIAPLDVVTALNPANKLEVVGTYTWAAESDVINSLAPGADAVADIFKNALNSTLASSTLPEGDPDGLITNILDLLFNNAGSAFKLILSNIPCLGLCDDVLGGAVYIGIGVNGTLGSVVDAALTDAFIPSMELAGDNSVPPNIVGGGIYTLTGARTFTQTFSGADGRHTYNFASGPA